MPPLIARGSGPWYRQPWPWLLMALPAIAVLAGFVTLWLAIRSDDGLVAGDYYRQGLAINRDLARERRAGIMALAAQVSVGREALEVTISAREGVRLPDRLRLDLAHATRPGMDRALMLVRTDGRYRVALAPLAAGKWQIGIEDEGGSWRLAGTIRLPEQSTVQLRSQSGEAK